MATGNNVVSWKGLHEILRGYVKTALLRTSFELRVYDEFAAGPRTAEEVGDRLGLHPHGARVLCDGLAAIGLLRTTDGGYELPPDGDRFLVTTGEQYFGGALKLGASDWEWEAQRRLTEAVRKGGTVMDTHALDPDFDYWLDFANNTAWYNNGAADLMAEQLTPWAQGRESMKVLDVACSHGSYGFFFARQVPTAEITCLDWPSVLDVTMANAEKLGLRDRVHPLPGDMFEVPLGGPYDLVMITNVLHHFREETAVQLLKRLAAVVKPGGRIAVVGHTYKDGETPEENPLPYMFSLIMLVMTDDGETHSVRTYDRMLTEAGFTNVQDYSSDRSVHALFLAERAS